MSKKQSPRGVIALSDLPRWVKPLSPPIALPWTEEAQRIVDTAPEDGT